jgi:hypothetical protein
MPLVELQLDCKQLEETFVVTETNFQINERNESIKEYPAS